MQDKVDKADKKAMGHDCDFDHAKDWKKRNKTDLPDLKKVDSAFENLKKAK